MGVCCTASRNAAAIRPEKAGRHASQPPRPAISSSAAENRNRRDAEIPPIPALVPCFRLKSSCSALFRLTAKRQVDNPNNRFSYSLKNNKHRPTTLPIIFSHPLFTAPTLRLYRSPPRGAPLAAAPRHRASCSCAPLVSRCAVPRRPPRPCSVTVGRDAWPPGPTGSRLHDHAP